MEPPRAISSLDGVKLNLSKPIYTEAIILNGKENKVEDGIPVQLITLLTKWHSTPYSSGKREN